MPPSHLTRFPITGARPTKFTKPRHFRGDARPDMNQSHRVGMARTQFAFVIMREKFRLVSRHVHVHRAIRLAAFAREAQIQTLFDFFAFPAVVNDFALQHFKQHVRAAARRMFFLARDHVTRAHRAAFAATAFADADAAQRAFGKIAVVLAVKKFRFRIPRMIIRSEPQILILMKRVHDFARIHFILRVPDFFELAKRLDQFFAEHDRQQIRLRLSVAVFAGNRTAQTHDQFRRLAHKFFVMLDSVLCFQAKINARVNAAVAKMSVKRAADIYIFQKVFAARANKSRLCPAARRCLPSLPTSPVRPARAPSRRARLRALPKFFSLRPGRRKVSCSARPVSFFKASINACALAFASSRVSPPNSAINQPFAFRHQLQILVVHF